MKELNINYKQVLSSIEMEKPALASIQVRFENGNELFFSYIKVI
jgi:hypothetical protein